MNSLNFIFICFIFVVANARSLHITREELQSNTWALIVSGANGWENYRMQADVCHAYHVFHDHMGISDDRIIVMMYDDIAFDSQNPFPGKIINDIGGPDVYYGVPHDYTGSSVTSDNFGKLMIGETASGGSGKTLKSTANDNVFIYYSDHGGMYALYFPDAPFTTNKMEDALNTMIQKNMFKNLIVYTDACYSGSMFYRMKNISDNIYVTTAAPVGEYAYSCNYDTDLRNFPCDLFSHTWMTDMEQNNKGGYTFNDEFDYVQQNVHFSQTCRYGGKDKFGAMTINSFFQLPDVEKSKKVAPGAHAGALRGENMGVSTIDAPLYLAQHVYEQEPTEENRKKLEKQLSIRKAVDKVIQRIVDAAKPGAEPATLTPCGSACDNSCPCYQYCLKEKEPNYCMVECCNEASACYSAPPHSNNGNIFDQCLETLSEEYANACGFKYDYLRKADGIFYRLCKRESVNVAAAVDEIHKQCNLFKNTNF